MIRSLRCQRELPDFCGLDPFGCKIISALSAYGTGYPFARFWVQENEGGAVAALCKLDGGMVLDAQKDADFTELRLFIAACGGVVSCGANAARGLCGSLPSGGGDVMLFEGSVPGLCGSVQEEPSPRDIHTLLSLCAGEGFSPPPFEPFYLDMSHRYRHGAAIACGLRANGVLAACAAAPAVTRDMAVLSAVAVRPDMRRRGLGTAVVRHLLARLGDRKRFVFRARGQNRGFYTNLGFRPWGEGWRELEASSIHLL